MIEISCQTLDGAGFEAFLLELLHHFLAEVALNQDFTATSRTAHATVSLEFGSEFFQGFVVAQQVGDECHFLAVASFLIEQHIHHLLSLLREGIASRLFHRVLRLFDFFIGGHVDIECCPKFFSPILHSVVIICPTAMKYAECGVVSTKIVLKSVFAKCKTN